MIRLRINYTGRVTGFSIMHFANELGDAQSAADAATDFLDDIKGGINTGQSMRVDPEVYEVNVGTGKVEGATTITPTTITGTNSDDVLPQQTQLLVRWRTGVFEDGRELRGRTFIAGYVQGASSAAGEVATTTQTTVNTAASTLVGNSDFGIWSPTHSMFATATSGTCWNEWAVQRGRRD